MIQGNQVHHDYLPFGEEIWAGTSLRSGSQGYTVPGASSADHVRQKYGETERDEGTGLDHTRWRKYESGAGRFTGADPYLGSMSLSAPQSFNRYAYVLNDPVNAIDPTGLCDAATGEGCDGGFWGVLSVFSSAALLRGGGSHALYRTSRMLIEPAESGPGKSQILNQAIARVVNRLKKKGCGDLFGNINPGFFLQNFVSIGDQDPSGAPFSSDATAAITRYDTVNGQRAPSGSIVFNQNSFFFTGTIGGNSINDILTPQVRQANGLGNLDLDGLRELIILHELMHINDMAGTYDDQNRGNPILNNLIRSKCF